MSGLFDSFVRAVGTAFHPRMLLLTVIPFAVAALGWLAIFWFGWEYAVSFVASMLGRWSLTSDLYSLFGSIGLATAHAVVAPFVVVVLAIPLMVMSVLVLIAAVAMPVVLRHLSRGRFALLEKRRGGSWFGSLFHSLGVTVVCLVLTIVTIPLWLIPPFFALLPPLLWGWLSYRVMSYDALAEHASPDERRAVVRRHRWSLLTIGVFTGLLGSVPTFVLASSMVVIVLFPIVAIGAVWLYIFIFVFSALWFGHYCLHALQQLRHTAEPSLPGAYSAPGANPDAGPGPDPARLIS
jgi:Etoposide-induced protein 2.4 (EI24)